MKHIGYVQTKSNKSVLSSITDMLEDEIDYPMQKVFNLLKSLPATLPKVIELLIEEAIGPNREVYASWFDADPELCIKSLFDQGNNQLVVPFLLSNMLNIAFLIVPDCNFMPLLPIIPNNNMTGEPMLLQYNIKSNTLEPLKKVEQDGELEKTKSSIRCRCGVNDKKKLSSIRKCSNMFLCSCKKNGKNCTEKCSCYNCGNNKVVTHQQTKRKREPHFLSFSNTAISSSSYLHMKNEESVKCMTSFQHFLLESILSRVLKDTKVDFGTYNSKLIIEEIRKIYEGILDMSKQLPDEIHIEAISNSSLEHWVQKRKAKYTIIDGLKTSLMQEA